MRNEKLEKLCRALQAERNQLQDQIRKVYSGGGGGGKISYPPMIIDCQGVHSTFPFFIFIEKHLLIVTFILPTTWGGG